MTPLPRPSPIPSPTPLLGTAAAAASGETCCKPQDTNIMNILTWGHIVAEFIQTIIKEEDNGKMLQNVCENGHLHKV